MTLPLALLHGFTGNPDNFSATIRALGHAPALLDAPALLGHAPAAPDEPSTFDGEVDRLAQRLRAKAPRWHLAGYSLGGRVALGLLVRHPSLFASATLIGAQPGLASDVERAERRVADERWCRLLEEHGIGVFVDEWQSLPLFATQRRLPLEVLATQRAERLRHAPAGLARSLRVLGLGSMPAYFDALSAISIPVTLVAGEHDEKFVKIARHMAHTLPHATVDIAADSGHNVVLERPLLMAAALSRQLRELK